MGTVEQQSQPRYQKQQQYTNPNHVNVQMANMVGKSGGSGRGRGGRGRGVKTTI